MDREGHMDVKRLPEEFLAESATLELRWKALRLNVQAWYERLSLAKGQSDIGCVGELLWTYNQVTIPSEESLQDDQQIDGILNWYRDRCHLNRANGAIFWYLHETSPVALGARLFARGVGPNWSPLWMWCELSHIHGNNEINPAFEIQIAGKDPSSLDNDAAMEALYRMQPRRVWHLSASKPGCSGIGGCTLNITTGDLGVGGLFDLWVDPQVQRQGIGTALVRSACQLARQLGCHHVLVNSTEAGMPTYRRVGFQSMGYGYTWFLDSKTLTKPPPSMIMVKFLEGVGLGDVKALDKVGAALTAEQLQEPSLNNMTPFEIAVRCKKLASAAWLLDHGVVPDIMSLWDMGWKDRAATLIVEHSELVERKAGRWTATPMHYAIERDDLELAKLLLTVPNDLEIRDAVFDSTPLGWARHFQRQEILKLLEAQTFLESESADGESNK
jgi:GNAT superfamily N-acetyltransferase